MSETLVVNASPLIFLDYIDGIHWLTRLASKPIIVPVVVIQEIEAGDSGAALVSRLHADADITISPKLELSPFIAAWDLGAGESQVLAYSQVNTGSRAVLDDKAARDCARSLNIPIIGTLGIVLAVKQRGWIPAAKPVINQLLAHELYLSTDLIKAALAEVGE